MSAIGVSRCILGFAYMRAYYLSMGSLLRRPLGEELGGIRMAPVR